MLRTFLPDSITLPDGAVLKHRIHYQPGIGRSKQFLIGRIKQLGGRYRLVEVLPRNLRKASDLYGSPYRPTTWILTNKSNVDVEAASSLHNPCRNQ